jgi:predicted ATPase
MEGRRLLRSLCVRNLLSFGEEGTRIELQPLNVLIGPNAAGKSNLIEAIGLLKAAPTDLTQPIYSGGGIEDWLWKGGRRTPVAELEATVYYPQGAMPLRYRIDLTQIGQRIEVVDETIEDEAPRYPSERDVYFYYRYQRGYPRINMRQVDEETGEPTSGRTVRRLQREDLKPDQSILSQRKEQDLYPEIFYLASRFDEIELFTEWSLGRYAVPRMPQRTDLSHHFLEPDASNLALVLNDLLIDPTIEEVLDDRLKLFYERATGINTRIHANTVQLLLKERGLRAAIPATRLSDGTIRYLCLLALLYHPKPPPLICIEEPELGMHPDILPVIAEMLREASQRTQLVVTTHSDLLVSEFEEVPEAIVVCERGNEGTTLRRLEDAPASQDEEGSLGERWLKGQIGGTRW